MQMKRLHCICMQAAPLQCSLQSMKCGGQELTGMLPSRCLRTDRPVDIAGISAVQGCGPMLSKSNDKRRHVPTTMNSSAVSFFAFGALLPAAAGWDAMPAAAADPPAVAPLRPAFGEVVIEAGNLLPLTLGLSAVAGDAGFVTRLFSLALLTVCKAMGDCESA